MLEITAYRRKRGRRRRRSMPYAVLLYAGAFLLTVILVYFMLVWFMPVTGSPSQAVRGQSDGGGTKDSMLPASVTSTTDDTQTDARSSEGNHATTDPSPPDGGSNEPERWEQAPGVLVNGQPIWLRKVPEAKGKIAITIDDGYDHDAIETILNAFRARSLRSTFFLVGDVFRMYPELWQQAYEDGHEFANHTYSHCRLSGLSDEEIRKELNLCEAEYFGHVGPEATPMQYVRPPYGDGGDNGSEKLSRSLLGTNYSAIVMWSIDSTDAKIGMSRLEHVLEKATDGAIILMHFDMSDAEYMGELLDGLLDKGLKPVTLSELFDCIS